METKIYAGSLISLDEDGCLVRCWDWNFEIGECIAQELGIKLSPDHWQVINLAREDFIRFGKSPNLDEILTHSKLDRDFIVSLFPKTPETTIARIAGIPKP